ncbi:unnamed protein product [Ixodes hexagonus]
MIAHEHSSDMMYLCHRREPELARCAPGLLFDDVDEACVTSWRARTSGNSYFYELYKSAANSARKEYEKAKAIYVCPSGSGYFPTTTDKLHYFEALDYLHYHFLPHSGLTLPALCSSVLSRRSGRELHCFVQPQKRTRPRRFRAYREEENLTPAVGSPATSAATVALGASTQFPSAVRLRTTLALLSATLEYTRGP